METITLYHGTTRECADRILSEGWAPRSGSMGGQCGNPRYLYLTNVWENALWYAEEKGCDTVLQIEVPASSLIVDPEDGIADTVEDELNSKNGLPGNVCLTRPLPASSFSLFQKPEFRP